MHVVYLADSNQVVITVIFTGSSCINLNETAFLPPHLEILVASYKDKLNSFLVLSLYLPKATEPGIACLSSPLFYTATPSFP